MADLEKSIQKLADMASKLNEAADRATEVLQSYEERIREIILDGGFTPKAISRHSKES